MNTDQDEGGGPLCDIDGNTPLILNDPERIWMIGSGAVDVFASHVTDGEPDGTRIHLFRATTSQVLFGIRPNPLRSDIALLAVGLPGTRLVTLNRARLIRLTEVLGFSGEALGWVDHWIAQLSAAISRQVPPPKYTLLEPDRHVELDEEGVACCPAAKGTLWVRQVSGSARFMDRTELSVTDGDGFFPVPQQTWLRASTASVLEVIDTETCLRRDPTWSNLEAFHNTVLQCVIWNTDESVQAERERLRQKAVSEQLAMEGALAQLASVLDARGPAVSRGADRRDPLREACRLVVAPLGITPQARDAAGAARVQSAMSSVKSEMTRLESGIWRIEPSAAAERPVADRLYDIARAWRIHVRKVVLRGDWWRGDQGPLVGFSEPGGKPLALLPVWPGRYEAVDPATGATVPVTASFAASLSYFAYCFYRPLRERVLDARRLLSFGMAGCGRDLRSLIVMGVLGALVAGVTPVATGLIFDAVIPGARRDQLWQLSGALLATALGMGLFHLTRGIAVLRIEGRMGAAIQAGVWDRLLSLPVAFFRRFSSGDLTDRAMGVDEVRRSVTSAAFSAIVAVALAGVSFTLMMYYDAVLAVLGGALLSVDLLVSTVASVSQLKLQRRYFDIAGRLSGLVLEFVTGIAKLRAAGAERRAFAVWANDFSEQKRVAVKARAIGTGLTVFDATYPLIVSLTLFGAVVSAGAHGLSTGAFLAFYAALGQCLGAMREIGDALMSVVRAVPQYQRIRPILDAQPEADVARTDPGELTGAIEISHVSFRYRSDGPMILDDVSLAIKAGEFVAIVGPSGAGKSTLLRLLLGFETPEAGAVYYDGQDLATLDLPTVRRRIGVVLQSGKLIPGDVLSNIIGSAPLTIDDAWEAARRAGLDEDIRAMPMGMHTVVGEGGSTFSGGQRQRLMIARAIVARPRMLLFDEATSALDNRTQALVSTSLEELQATRIVIAHRLSTIRNADQIYVVDGGRIVQHGTYDDLMNERGLFAALARRQLA